jgi:hypothetical protein
MDGLSYAGFWFLLRVRTEEVISGGKSGMLLLIRLWLCLENGGLWIFPDDITEVIFNDALILSSVDFSHKRMITIIVFGVISVIFWWHFGGIEINLGKKALSFSLNWLK